MNLSSLIEAMQEKLSTIFDKDELSTLAFDHRFIVRSTNRIEAIDFVELMSIQLWKNPELSLEGMCDILSAKNPNTEISRQGLQQRINSQSAVDFLSAVLVDCLSQALNNFNLTPPQLLTPFRRILLQDSTQIKLNDALCDTFCGCGGSGGKAALKLHLVYDFHQHQLSEVLLTNATTSETEIGLPVLKADRQSVGCLPATRQVEKIFKNDLVVRDLGYFCLDQLAKIDYKQAFFLSRLLSSVGMYLSNAPLPVTKADRPFFRVNTTD